MFNISNKIFGPKSGGYTLQDSGNLFMDNVIYFHNLVLCILFFILILVTWFLITTLLYFGNPKFYKVLSFNYNKILMVVFMLIDIFLFYCIAIYDYLNPYSFNYFKSIRKGTHIYFVSYTLVHGEDSESFIDFIKRKDIGYRYYFYSDIKLEFLWTVFPSVILLFLAIPSFGLLFSIEKVSAPEITVKIIGHQWYWEYQYMDYINFKEVVETDTHKFIYKNKEDDNYIIESYMIADEDLAKGQFRLLEVDKKLILPTNTSIRLLITSDDVLHSWAVPSLGIKVDACPGRINELVINIRDIGIYYGQCSELCGWYHGFMPIVIQSLNVEDFKYWAMASFLDIKYMKKNVS
jgi:heme/copper-type cytochrome/quinol oxidase subunit 2|nr:cytochrome c oxidase subunit 2 [Actinophrys sol]